MKTHFQSGRCIITISSTSSNGAIPAISLREKKAKRYLSNNKKTYCLINNRLNSRDKNGGVGKLKKNSEPFLLGLCESKFKVFPAILRTQRIVIEGIRSKVMN